MPANVATGAADLEFNMNSYDYSSEDSDVAFSSNSVWGRVRRAGLGRAAAIGAVSAAGLLVVLAASPHGAARASPSSVLGLNDAGTAAATQAMQAASQQLSTGSEQAVGPQEHLNDGNPCSDDEELHAGLCYAKCSGLTDGAYIYRQSAWTCCKQATCSNIFQLAGCCKHNMGWCSGFDIAGMDEGKKICPHKPGACLKDEEFFLNLCYMKCSSLTAGLYPYRTAPATCCKSKGVNCMVQDGVQDGINGQAITNASFAVGGGCGDDHNSTHCKPHMPQQSLTES